MMMHGNTILIAGGTSGIGRGLAELLCRLGNEVLIFGAQPGAAQAIARANPGMRAVDLDLADPWSVAGFSEQIAATCPSLNMLVNISIAFPAKYLPGLDTLLDDDGSYEKLEAHRLGMQQLTGALLPYFRKRTHSAILNVSAGPMLASPIAQRGRGSNSPAIDSGMSACVMSVRKRWAGASIGVIDVARPSRAERMSPGRASRPHEVPRGEFLSSLAQLLSEGLPEAAALSRLRALWPVVRAAASTTRNDDLVSQAY